jgi:S1-C subfamily serine protease
MQPVRLPEGMTRRLGLANDVALIVVRVEPDGPGDRAGVTLGDVLVSLDGTPVSDPGEVLAALGPDRIGKPITARVVRGGAATDVTITVGERPRGGR